MRTTKRPRLPRPRLCAALFFACAFATPCSVRAQAEVYVAKGACPFECCSYGIWPVRAAAQVRSRPDTSADLIDVLAEGSRIEAVTGEVHVRPGLARIVGTVPPEGAGLDPALPVEILDYVGEGFSHVRQGDHLVEVKIARSAEQCAASPNPRYCWAEVLREPVLAWWVEVRRPDAGLGWVRMDGALEAADACR